jgi:hypothetical protein
MSGSALKQRLLDMQMERVENDTFPSVEMMNRIEASLQDEDELEKYAGILWKKIESTEWPSLAMINRFEGVLARLDQLSAASASR